MAGLILALVALYPLASILTVIGLASRFGSLNIFKLASYGLVIMGVLAGINFLVVQHATGYDVESMLIINNILLWIGSFALLAIRVGMYQGRSELSSKD